MNGARARLLWAWLGYIAVILYGSFIPFELRLNSLEQAWAAFQQIRFLDLSVVSRADWIANIILYVPLSYLGARYCSLWPFFERRRGLTAVLMLAFGWLLAVAVEFFQTFFAPRTVSLNDLIAEAIGTVLGLLLWAYAGEPLQRLWRQARRQGAASLRAALALYALAYVFMVLFPFDFLISLEELRWKLEGGSVGLLLAECAHPGYCAGSLAMEAVAMAPLGLLAALQLRRYELSVARWQLAGYAVLIALLIEGIQLFLASGVAQGASVAMRALGFYAGSVWLLQWPLARLRRLEPWARPAVLMALPFYLLTLAYLNSWFDAVMPASAELLEKLRQQRFIPFFYHYYTSEPVAMRSVLNYFALYAPVGVGFWLWWRGWLREPAPSVLWSSAAVAAALALVMESGKLLVPGKHPDYTDVLIAAVAASASFLALVALRRRLLAGEAGAADDESGLSVKPGALARPGGEMAKAVVAPAGSFARAAGVLFLLLAGYACLTFPVARGWLLLGLAGYAVLLWRWPGAWLLVLPVLLPVLDLGKWSGRLYVDEFDLFVLMTLAVLCWRVPLAQAGARQAWRPYAGVLALFLVYAVSAVFALLPWAPPTLDDFYSYYSQYNGLRLLKPLLALLLLLPFLIVAGRQGVPVRRYFIFGSVLGLAGVVVKILWERAVFVGLLDFDSPFRVDGGFSEMHAGSGYVEAYLAFALPLAAVWIWRAPRAGLRLGAGLLFALGVYALFVTYSRGGYGAFVLAMSVLLGMMWASKRRLSARRMALALAGVVALAGATAYPVLSGEFAQARLSTIAVDMTARLNHWRHSLAMMEDDLRTNLLGMGLGSFPRNYLWNSSADAAPATYRYIEEPDRVVLRLGAGSPPIYLDQQIHRPEGRYTVQARLRGPAGSVLHVFICEKNLLYSFRCQTIPLPVGEAADGGWQERQVETGLFAGDDDSVPGRPLVLSLFNPVAGTAVDIDRVVLIDETGRDLVRNGAFWQGGDHWLFTSDTFWPWHVENIFLQVFFDLGWLGLILLLAVLGRLVWLLLKRGEAADQALLAALTGFVATGFFSSLLDAPRFLFLFYLLVLVALAGQAARNEEKFH